MRYSDYVNEVRRDVLEAPSATIERDVRDAAIAFCQSSRVWTERRVVAVEALTEQVRLKPSQEGRVDQVLRAVYRNAAGSEYELRKVMDRYTTNPAEGQPRYYSEGLQRSNPVIHLLPFPQEACDLDLNVVLVPQRDGTALPDHISERWHDAIVDGALSRLLMQSSKPWTNPEKAMFHRHRFDLAVRDGRQKAASDSWAPTSVPLRRWV